ncbi:MAG: PIN domain nuclease [Phycisphaerales bacterium]|nr:PIN domain nuclease [Phycisphaerales bacterium]
METYVAAADIYRRCRKAGITPRSSIDCLIVQIALESEAGLLHADRDYLRIAQVVPDLILL